MTVGLFEKHMRAINNMFVKHESIFDLILAEIRGIREEHQDFKKTLLIQDRGLGLHERKIDDLTGRVEKLEIKTG